MFPRARYQFQLEIWCVSMELDNSGITSQSDQPAGVPSCLQRRFSANILTPKDNVSFILASVTNRSHPVNSRSLLDSCFTVSVYIETWWPMFNVHLSYKPLGGYCFNLGTPQAVQSSEKIRALVVPGGGCSKGIVFKELSRLWESYQINSHA